MNPPYIVNRVARLSVDVDNPVAFRERTLGYVRECVHVIPAALVFPKTRELKGWVVVRRDDDRPTVINGDIPLTTAYLRNAVKRYGKRYAEESVDGATSEDRQRGDRSSRRLRRRRQRRPPM